MCSRAQAPKHREEATSCPPHCPGGPAISSSLLSPTAAKHALAPYNHLIIAIIWYDLTTLPAYYSVRKHRKRFNYAPCNRCIKESLSIVVNLKRYFL